MKIVIALLFVCLSGAAVALNARTVVEDTESFDCSGKMVGITSASSSKSFEGFPLCVYDISCKAKKAAQGVPAGGERGFLVTCKPTKGVCPATKEACIADAYRKGRDFMTKAATIAADDGEPVQGRRCTYSTKATGDQAALALFRANGEAEDVLCLASANCNPTIDEEAVVCLPKSVTEVSGPDGKKRKDVTCHPASVCVAGRFPLEKERKAVVEVNSNDAPARTSVRPQGHTPR